MERSDKAEGIVVSFVNFLMDLLLLESSYLKIDMAGHLMRLGIFGEYKEK